MQKSGQPCTLGYSQRNKWIPLLSQHQRRRAELSRHTCIRPWGCISHNANADTEVQRSLRDSPAPPCVLPKAGHKQSPSFTKTRICMGISGAILTLSLGKSHAWSTWGKDGVSCFIWPVQIGGSDLTAKVVMLCLPYPLMPCSLCRWLVKQLFTRWLWHNVSPSSFLYHYSSTFARNFFLSAATYCSATEYPQLDRNPALFLCEVLKPQDSLVPPHKASDWIWTGSHVEGRPRHAFEHSLLFTSCTATNEKRWEDRTRGWSL